MPVWNSWWKFPKVCLCHFSTGHSMCAVRHLCFEQIINLGCDRILGTSGQQAIPLESWHTLLKEPAKGLWRAESPLPAGCGANEKNILPDCKRDRYSGIPFPHGRVSKAERHTRMRLGPCGEELSISARWAECNNQKRVKLIRLKPHFCHLDYVVVAAWKQSNFVSC